MKSGYQTPCSKCSRVQSASSCQAHMRYCMRCVGHVDRLQPRSPRHVQILGVRDFTNATMQATFSGRGRERQVSQHWTSHEVASPSSKGPKPKLQVTVLVTISMSAQAVCAGKCQQAAGEQLASMRSVQAYQAVLLEDQAAERSACGHFPTANLFLTGRRILKNDNVSCVREKQMISQSRCRPRVMRCPCAAAAVCLNS